MTTTRQVSDYTDKITSYFAGQPNFVAVVELLVTPYVYLQQFLASIPATFDLDVAIGVQLDQVGQWVGYTRNVLVPLTGVYFSLDTPNLGFDQGVWESPFSPTQGVVQLDDESYRLYLRCCIVANSWDGTVADAATALAYVFASPTYAYVDDRGDMTAVFGLSGTLPNALFVALFRAGLIPLKPEAVQVNWLATSIDGAPIFGFDVSNNYLGGFDVGAWGS